MDMLVIAKKCPSGMRIDIIGNKEGVRCVMEVSQIAKECPSGL